VDYRNADLFLQFFLRRTHFFQWSLKDVDAGWIFIGGEKDCSFKEAPTKIPRGSSWCDNPNLAFISPVALSLTEITVLFK